MDNGANVPDNVKAFSCKHAHFSEEVIDDIAKAYRHIYQSGTSLFNAMRRIEADIEPCKQRDEILTFIRDNDSRIVGISTAVD